MTFQTAIIIKTQDKYQQQQQQKKRVGNREFVDTTGGGSSVCPYKARRLTRHPPSRNTQIPFIRNKNKNLKKKQTNNNNDIKKNNQKPTSRNRLKSENN